MTEAHDEPRPGSRRFNRRALIATSAGVAGTVAVTSIVPGAVPLASAAPSVAIPVPGTPIPSDPVVAYIHDAGRGEVTVVSGASERTYRDPLLVKRLLAAADSQTLPTTEGK